MDHISYSQDQIEKPVRDEITDESSKSARSRATRNESDDYFRSETTNQCCS